MNVHVYTPESLRGTISAIQEVLLKKDEIIYTVKRDDTFYMRLCNGDVFRSSVAICGNFLKDIAQVRIDPEVFSVSDLYEVYRCAPTLRYYLCIKFAKGNPDVRLYDAAMYPVNGETAFDKELSSSWRYDVERRTPMFWLNEKRWEMLKFLKDELEKILETNMVESL